MNAARSIYRVHAELRPTGNSAGFDDVEAGRPVERRLNRMERVVTAYRGQIDKRSGNSLQIAFDTADAATLAACEMQQRCAILPQLSGNRIALRIGVHRAIVQQRSEDRLEDASAIAVQLASADDSVIVSGIVAEALNAELRKFCEPFAGLPADLAAVQIDWRADIPSAAYGGEALWPASRVGRPLGSYLALHQGLKTLELTQDCTEATVGRDPLNDMVLVDDYVSRNHCRIVRRFDCIVLTDTSTNGTCITPDEGSELLVRNDTVVLRGKGLLFFGRTCNGERRGGVRYEAY